MPLTVTRRRDTGALTIVGTVAGTRVRRRAQSNSLALAREEAAALEATILRNAWHGERRGARSLDEAIVSYLEAAPRSERTKQMLSRIRDVLGGAAPLSTIDQDAVTRLRQSLIPQAAGAATYIRTILTPLRAVMRHAADQGWCDAPRFVTPRVALGRTAYMLPGEAERLIAAATPYIRPLLIFLLCTGARMSEALELDWRDVDLVGARAIFWRTKNAKRRVAALPDRCTRALAEMGGRHGPVFRTPAGRPYADRRRIRGGQIATPWATAIKRAGLDPTLRPHDCRHTWASWHYALHRDLLALKLEGGWSTISMVERYAHLLPAGHEAAIRKFWGI